MLAENLNADDSSCCGLGPIDPKGKTVKDDQLKKRVIKHEALAETTRSSTNECRDVRNRDRYILYSCLTNSTQVSSQPSTKTEEPKGEGLEWSILASSGPYYHHLQIFFPAMSPRYN